MNTFRRGFCALALSVCAAMPLAAQEVIYARELPPASFHDLERLELPAQAPRVRTHRFVPPMQVASSVTLAPETTAVTAPAIAAPPMQLTFTSASSKQLSPADASGAVGKSHIIGAYNAGLVIHDRAGNIVGSASLRQFWAVSQVIGDQYDPRVAYDPQNDRFIVMSIDREQALLFAVSDSGDPTGGWRRFSVPFNPSEYVDFSRIAVTRDTVILATCTGTEDTNDTSVMLSINKSDLYGTASPVPMRKSRLTGFPDAVPVTGDTASVEYLINLEFPDVRIGRLDQPGSWRRVHGPEWLSFAGPNLPQPATGVTLDGGFPHIESAMFRNGSIYAVMTTGGPSGQSQSGIAWVRIDAESLSSTWGSVRDDASRTYYAYPSLAVNANGAMLIGFGTFSNTQYPSAAYVTVDVLGRASAPALIKSGDSAVVITDRWGDYTTTMADPLEPASLWTVQICSNQNTWGTVWAKVEVNAARRRSVRH